MDTSSRTGEPGAAERVRFVMAADLYLRSVLSLEDAASLAERPIQLFERELADNFRVLVGGANGEVGLGETGALLLSVVIPVYNERATFLKLLDAVRAVPIHKEILVV